ncbi:MAG TPA: RiPP maturation radical SAM C-methyltransferase, partial [Negativicutes bacterium]
MALIEKMDVCLVNMPFADLAHPSLALGLLKSALMKAGIKTKVEYGNLAFAELVGVYNYQSITHSYRQSFGGEFVFSKVAFSGYGMPDDEAYYTYRRLNCPAVVDPHFLNRLLDIVRQVRSVVESFTDEVAKRIVAGHPKIVGCVSLFEQNCASLALLRRIKQLDSTVVTVMGGDNCEGVAGLAMVETFPWLDFAISGEADHCFTLFCQTVLSKRSGFDNEALPYGVLWAGMPIPGDGQLPRLVIQDMDSTPIPDYDEYFHILKYSPLQKHIIPGLLVETSRGCWWGEKHPCTFCGLNGQGYRYRPKSQRRVAAEFDVLARRYALNSFEATDNILGMKQLDTVIDDFSTLPSKYNIFYETKSNLTRKQLSKMVEAGIRWIQPGIESLHDGPLILMNKGNKAIHHVEILKNALELGIRCSWNLLWGFPGEKPEWYGEMTAWIEQIIHLQPPNDMIQIAFDRGSIYVNQPERYGLSLRPVKGYQYIYPDLPGLINRLAHYFENVGNPDGMRTGATTQIHPVYQQLEEKIKVWVEQFWSKARALLNITYVSETVWEITDSRPCAVQSLHVLQGVTKDVYQVCRTVTA